MGTPMTASEARITTTVEQLESSASRLLESMDKQRLTSSLMDHIQELMASESLTLNGQAVAVLAAYGLAKITDNNNQLRRLESET